MNVRLPRQQQATVDERPPQFARLRGAALVSRGHDRSALAGVAQLGAATTCGRRGRRPSPTTNPQP